MANYSSTAKVTLSVNGKQAEQMLSKLQDDARRLQNRIEEAAKAGDKVTMKKFQRELNSTNRLMNQLRGSSVSTEEVMKRLDRASPKELNKVLRQLKAELNNIERGSAAWDAQIAKIKQVRSEIAEGDSGTSFRSASSASPPPSQDSWRRERPP